MQEDLITIKDLGFIDYPTGLKVQEHYKDLVRQNIIKGAFLLLEHKPVYTLGKKDKNPEGYYSYLKKIAEIYSVDRGGDITFHGPGQLVCYPILNLYYWQQDLHLYLMALEEVIIKLLKNYNITAGRKYKYTGVWVNNEKICSIGIACKNWITWHGLALNVDVDLDYFNYIVPCGIKDFGVTSLKKTGIKTTVDEIKSQLIPIIKEVFHFDTYYSTMA